MKGYAPIAPIPILEQLIAVGEFGNYHMVLAPQVQKNLAAYEKIYRDKGHFVILDNGAAEGERITSSLMQLATTVSATAVCLPDELRNRSKTLRLVDDFVRRQSGRFTGYMGIPQGKNLEDVLKCADGIMQILGEPPRYWGVPRWMANEFGSRKLVVQALSVSHYQRDFGWNEPNIHMLGMSENYEDDIKCTQLPMVMGIDSANPIVMGQWLKTLPDEFEHLPRKLGDWDFWAEDKITAETIHNIGVVRQQINERG